MEAPEGIWNRDQLMDALFRETDRVQRMKTPLALILMGVTECCGGRVVAFGCEELLQEAAERTGRLLRSYDFWGRVGAGELLLILPGCTAESAVLLAERIELEISEAEFLAKGGRTSLSACFGIAVSGGRSPMVVLREAETALRLARERGGGTIQCIRQAEEFLEDEIGEQASRSGQSNRASV
jgi:two-component system cell cycle response regulator